MKYWMVFAILLASTLARAEVELEGRDGLKRACMTNPGNTDSFCTCLADRAVAELTQSQRQQLYVDLIYPSVFDFKKAMTPYDLPESIEKFFWGPFQRGAVPACRAANPSKSLQPVK